MIQGIHLKGKTRQLLEDNTEHVSLGSGVLANHKTKIHKFTYIKIKISVSQKMLYMQEEKHPTRGKYLQNELPTKNWYWILRRTPEN